jgi:two-component system cell cycle response regulator DivK
MPAVNKIVIFDDDADLLGIFRFLFEDSGWEVYAFENCNDLIRKTKEIMPRLILMDNWIPPQGGIIATQMIKNDSILKEIPVIFVSANNDVKELAIKAGADAYTEKPFDFDVLNDLAILLINKPRA